MAGEVVVAEMVAAEMVIGVALPQGNYFFSLLIHSFCLCND